MKSNNMDNLDLDFDTEHRVWDKLPTMKAVVCWLATLFLLTQVVFFFDSQGDDVHSLGYLGRKVQNRSFIASTIGGSRLNGHSFGCSRSAAILAPEIQKVSDSRYVIPSDVEPSVYCDESASHETLRAGDYIEKDLLCGARKAAMVPLAGKPKLAFLFLVRGEIVFEPLWRRFFHGNEESYSVYVHASNASYDYPESSFFHGKSVLSRPVKRFSMTLVDAQRRLLAHALRDSRNANAWFTFVCEKTLPVRNFPFIFNYITNSETSFVEAFLPKLATRRKWNQEPEFRRNQTRKGEAWMSVHRRHAGLIVAESKLYAKFDRDLVGAAHDESYIQTMLAMVDAQGIANRTVMYVDWSDPHHSSHPSLIRVRNATQGAATFRKIQQQTWNEDGYFIDSRERGSDDNEPSCMYNGSPFSNCYMFARKFAAGGEEVEALLSLPKEVLGY
ncbi:hypothetical protein KC19_8G142300 [Ceratodon purpureus]|uniref:Uncharacterized protein n=1 Tax=Ceratodon purpureus TaxID=3225 RepID=A0A8T0GYT9_CERPU|nr:hypothetical protein KC19_8G142300 [Ceratodon purpureus]